MTLRRSGPRTTLLSSVVAATVLAALTTSVPAANAALGAPGGLTVANKNSNTPILSWAKVKKAASYQVQVDNDPAFATPEFSATTVNFRAVPTAALRPGVNHWRVRATAGTTNSNWAGASLTVSPVGVPVPTAPANGAALAQPQDAPLLRWDGSQGAISYTVEVDGDEDFIGAKSYVTKTTSLVVPDPLVAGDYYWRVTATKAAGIVSLPSAASRFDILPLAAPSLVFPPNDVNLPVEDVVMDWAPVAGAKSYDLQVATDAGFNTITESKLGLVSTRYSPITTYDNNQYWWRVRAVDLAGQSTAWTESLLGYKREWPDKPQAVYPLGSTASPTPLTTAAPYFQWTPVQHASTYEVQLANDANFSNIVRTCTTASTTFTPGINMSPACNLNTGATTYWRVRPRDLPFSGGGVQGIYSDPQAVVWNPPAPGTFSGTFERVPGLQIAIDGQAVGGPGACSDVLCDNVPTTPVLSWDPQPGVTHYRVYVAEDANFTNLVNNVIATTTNSRFAFRTGAIATALAESQAGQAYYWYIRPCTGTVNSPSCGPDPVSQNPPLPGSKSFRKASPGIAGPVASDPGGSEIAFAWNDYFDTNRATNWRGELSNQSAQKYRVQVDTDPSFSGALVDTRDVDQATYTAFDRLYPEGDLYWRVQALDAGGNGLTWSPVQSFIKSSAAVGLSSPPNGSAVTGTTPFTWQAQAFAQSYTIEVYKNNDAAFSQGNRMFAATVKTASYAWDRPLPADPTPYIWRVRRTDASGNLGAWSSPARFTSLGAAPALLTPSNNVWQPTAGPLFEWTEVTGAASYFLDIRLLGGTASYLNATTAATAHAPAKAIATGSYTWRVTARDANGAALGTSATRAFRVDATPPTIKKIKPTSKKLKPNSIVTVIFSEKVKGVSNKSLYITPEGKKKPMKAKVKIDKKGKKATIDVKKRFKSGTYIVRATTKIKDVAGNPLAGTSGAITR